MLCQHLPGVKIPVLLFIYDFLQYQIMYLQVLNKIFHEHKQNFTFSHTKPESSYKILSVTKFLVAKIISKCGDAPQNPENVTKFWASFQSIAPKKNEAYTMIRNATGRPSTQLSGSCSYFRHFGWLLHNGCDCHLSMLLQLLISQPVTHFASLSVRVFGNNEPNVSIGLNDLCIRMESTYYRSQIKLLKWH